MTRYSIYEVDVKDYVEWLDGDSPTKESLMEYLYDACDTIDGYDDDFYCQESELGDTNVAELLNQAEDLQENIPPKPTIF